MKKIGFINGLRGIAIIGAVFHHVFFNSLQYGLAGSTLPWALQAFFSSGWLGVNLFFFLSGFVLFLPYATGQRALATSGDIKHFYARRLNRLIPLYYFIALMTVIFVTQMPVGSGGFFLQIFLYATVLFPFFRETFTPPGNWVLWSIGVEIWFSVLFPLIAIAVLRIGWRRMLLLIIALSAIVRFAGQVGFYQPPNILNYVSDSVLGRLDEFLWGMSAAALYAGAGKNHRPVFFLPLGLAFAAFAMGLWALWYRQALPVWSAAFFSWFLDSGIFLMVVYIGSRDNLIRKVLEIKPLQLLGMMCYSIYMWHAIVLSQFTSISGQWLQYILYLLAVLALSFFTYRFIEFRRVEKIRDLFP